MNILNLNSIIMNLNLNINFQQHMHIMKQNLVPYMARHIPLLNRYECRRLQQIRTEDGIPLDPSIDSVFNCHSVYGRCQYYRPAHFFHPTCSSISSMGSMGRDVNVNVNVNTNENANANANDGTPNIISSSATAGSRTRNMKPKQKKTKRNEKVVLQTFQTHLQQMIQLRTNRELWVGQPPIIMPYVSFPNPSDGVILKHEKEKHNAKNTNDNVDNVDNTNTNENVNDARRGKRNLSFIHIHKTGGTTMVTAMRDLIVIDDTHTDTHTDTGDGNATDSIVGIEGRKKSTNTNTNTGAKSNSKSNVNTDTNMDSNNNKNGSNQYTGSFNIYTQFRTRRRSKRAWKDADRFIDRAVRYQREDKWDDIHEIEIEEDDSNDDNNGRQDVLDDVISVETTRTDTTITTTTTTTTTTTVDMNHMIFALVRDPAERFISAVGQVTSSKFASKGRAKQFKDLCIPPSYEHQEEGEHENEHKNEDGREHEHEQMEQHHDEIKTSDVLRCYVNIVKNQGYWVRTSCHFFFLS